MKAAGLFITGLFALLVFGIVPKTQAASSGVVTATVQIKQPTNAYAQAHSPISTPEFIFASLTIIPQLITSTSSLPVLPFKIIISTKSSQYTFGSA